MEQAKTSPQAMATHYQHWQASGLSQMANSKAHGLTFSKFNYWCRKFQQPAAKSDSGKQKTVLLINAHLVYPGLSEGKLNIAFSEAAKKYFTSKSYRVLETKISDGYDTEKEVEKFMQADVVILQTPVNWESTPWIYKRYVDDVFTSAMFSQKFLSGDGRSPKYPTRQYGTGDKMQGKRFMLSATWNAPKERFNDPPQKLWAGSSVDEVLFGVAANYRFVGFEVLPGYHCYDIFHNKHIKQDLEKYPLHLEKVLKD
jgi:NADPH dehydrogenase (quinone)